MKRAGLFILIFLLVILMGCTYEEKELVFENTEQDIIENNEDQTELTEKTEDIIPEAIIENIEPCEILGVDKQFSILCDVHSECSEILARTEFSSISLRNSYADKYPALAETLKQYALMQENTMSDEFDNHIAFAYEDIEANGFDGWAPYVSETDRQVRRADSVAFSMLDDSYSNTPYNEGFRSFAAYNIDTQTGKTLLITDIVKDMESLPEIIKNEITSHMWTGEFKSEYAVSEYFDNTYYSDISFTLDYNGVTFYFNAGTVADEVYGIVTANVSFAEYPEIFVKKYMNVPESYAVRLPVTASFFTDIDNDGKTDELVFTAYKDEESGYYSQACIVTADDSYEEDFVACGFNPYYVKTADNRHFLYIFAEGADDFNRLMRLHVYEITGGKTEKLGEAAFAPHHSADEDGNDIFTLPLNPECMLLDVFYEEEGYFYPRYAKEYCIDEEGFPSDLIYVSSVKELLDSISNGANICIEKGNYSISDFINAMTEADIEKWNSENPVVKLRECHDGYEVVIENVSDLTIFGEAEKADEVEFVTDYRYATVFCFENCYNISLSGVKLGHTEMGECAGDVLNFSGCNEVYIDNSDLYGCGVYGIVADSYSGDFYVYNTRIHDCLDGPLYIIDGLGDYTFTECVLENSDGYGIYQKTADSDLYFINCTFGKKETESFKFNEEVYTENCTWCEDEDIIYPEFGYGDEG